jgi:hypothetical protein
LITENDILLIDRFINGDLSSLEHLEFEKRVKADLEFAKEVRLQQKVIDGLKIYGTAQMAAVVKTNFKDWKADGFKAYSAPRIIKPWVKVLVGVGVVAAGVAGYFLLTQSHDHEPPKEQHAPVADTTNPEMPDIQVPAPAELEEDTFVEEAGVEGMNLIQLKTSETQTADMTLDVQDPSSFSARKIKESDGVYTYELKYDDKVEHVESLQDNLDVILNQQARAVNTPVNTASDEVQTQ